MAGKQGDLQPEWQPITRLALIASHIDGMLEAAEEQYANLLEARPKPYVLDDFTVGRVFQVFTAQQQDLWLFDEQVRRWKVGTLTAAQREEVERLAGQMAKLRQVIGSILELAKELQEGTIEKQMAKSDLELGRGMARIRSWDSHMSRSSHKYPYSYCSTVILARKASSGGLLFSFFALASFFSSMGE